jgi:hypothetical protein
MREPGIRRAAHAKRKVPVFKRPAPFYIRLPLGCSHGRFTTKQPSFSL